MERLCYVFTIFLSVLCSSQPASGQGGVFIEYGGVVLSNFGVGSHMDVGTDPNPNSVGTNLVCRTDSIDCCGGVFEVTQGSWYYPSGIQVQINSENTESLPSGQIYRQQGGDQVVRLRRLSGQSITTAANGIYRCEVADLDGVMQTRYFGLYTETNEMPNGVGVVSISQAPQFSLISVDPLEFTLTSTTTGGPPTTAFWTQSNTSFFFPGDTFSQRVVYAVAATVEHTLTVTERVTGNYTFSTTNARNGPATCITGSITVEDANPPSGLMVVESSLTSVEVSWTAPAPGGATHSGYRIFYETGGSEQSVDAGAGATSHTLNGLQSGATYSISIVALSHTLPSSVLGPEMVIVAVPNQVNSLEAHVRFTSIVLTWNEPQRFPNGIILCYEVSYWLTKEERASALRTTSVMATSFTLSNLNLNTSWTFEVAAVNRAGHGEAMTIAASALSEEGGAQFQLQLSPVEHCTTWSSSKAQQMRKHIHTAIVAAIVKQKVDSFDASLLLNGFFRCWHSPTEVTYRSSITGIGAFNATQLVAFLEDWVASGPVVRMEEFELQVLGGCPVALSSLSDPECPPSATSQLPTDPTLITRDPAVIVCVNGATITCN